MTVRNVAMLEVSNLAELAEAVRALTKLAKEEGRDPADVEIPPHCGRFVLSEGYSPDGPGSFTLVSMPTEADAG